MRIAEHAVINETVAACKQLKREWAKGLVNAVLRKVQRQNNHFQININKILFFAMLIPKWMIEQLNQSWSESGAEQILAANNQQAPMTLRELMP